MKKIILGMLVLGSCIAGITYGAWGDMLPQIIDLPGEFGYRGNDYILNEIDTQISFENGQLLFHPTNQNNRYFTFGWKDGQPFGIATYGNSILYGQGIMSVCESTVELYQTECSLYLHGGGNNGWKGLTKTPRDEINKNMTFDKFFYAYYEQAQTSITDVGTFGFISTAQDTVLVFFYNISYGATESGAMFSETTNYNIDMSNATSDTDRFNIFDETSPFIAGGGEDEPIITGYDPETGLPCATIDTLIKYETNFKTGMCYSSTYIYSGGQMETITPKTFTELRTGYNQFNNDLNKYRNYCTPPATNEACQNAFGNEEEKRSIINKIPEERLTDGGKTLYDYCHMYLTYSGDTNICEIDDKELRSASYEDLINAMNEITITQPGTGSVFDNYKDQTARNIITALPSVYYKITSIFKNNTGVKGIIPSYITWIIILIVLFKLFKK